MSPKSSCVKVPNAAVVRGRRFMRWLDNYCNFINGFLLLQIHNWMAYWEVAGTLERRDPSQKKWVTAPWTWRLSFTPGLFSLLAPWPQRDEWICSHSHKLRDSAAGVRRLKPVQWWARTNLSSFKLTYSDILPEGWKQAQSVLYFDYEVTIHCYPDFMTEASPVTIHQNRCIYGINFF